MRPTCLPHSVLRGTLPFPPPPGSYMGVVCDDYEECFGPAAAPRARFRVCVHCHCVPRRLSASGIADQNNTQDVKELTPEFFYLPDFLVNTNGLPMGTRQDGRVVNHVELPPWARGSAREFVILHRRALECEYVLQPIVMRGGRWCASGTGAACFPPPLLLLSLTLCHLALRNNLAGLV